METCPVTTPKDEDFSTRPGSRRSRGQRSEFGKPEKSRFCLLLITGRGYLRILTVATKQISGAELIKMNMVDTEDLVGQA